MAYPYRAERERDDMGSTEPKRNLENVLVAKGDAEKIVTAIALRYGLRVQDFTMAWDEGSFEASRVEHDLLIIRKDGSRANVRTDGDTLLRRDTWMYFRDLEAAFTQLNRRKFLR